MTKSRLKTYAHTAGSTVALAAAGLAGADIMTSSGSTAVTLNAGAITLFSIGDIDFYASNRRVGHWNSSGTGFANLSPTSSVSLWNLAMVDSGVAINTGFSGGSGIGQQMYFTNSALSTTYAGITGSMELGENQIVGFSFSDSGDSYYGWVNYALSMFEDEFTFTINSWAYNDVANEGIIAGQNQAAGSSAVPGLGGLAALAIGAAGVRSRRQRTVA